MKSSTVLRRIERQTAKTRRKRAGSVMRWRREMKQVGPTRDERLSLLQRWAEVRVKPMPGETPQGRRAAYLRWSGRPTDPIGVCWACREVVTSLVNHHVIQIQHGGHNWHLNIVRICRDCHAVIHPWLRE